MSHLRVGILTSLIHPEAGILTRLIHPLGLRFGGTFRAMTTPASGHDPGQHMSPVGDVADQDRGQADSCRSNDPRYRQAHYTE